MADSQEAQSRGPGGNGQPPHTAPLESPRDGWKPGNICDVSPDGRIVSAFWKFLAYYMYLSNNLLQIAAEDYISSIAIPAERIPKRDRLRLVNQQRDLLRDVTQLAEWLAGRIADRLPALFHGGPNDGLDIGPRDILALARAVDREYDRLLRGDSDGPGIVPDRNELLIRVISLAGAVSSALDPLSFDTLDDGIPRPTSGYLENWTDEVAALYPESPIPRGYVALFFFEWAHDHLRTEPQAWNFQAKIPICFQKRWSVAGLDREGKNTVAVPESVALERRRNLLIEVGLLRIDQSSDLAPAGKALAASDRAATGHPLIILRGLADAPIVRGNRKPLLTVARYNVVKVLMDAGVEGLTGDELVRESGHGGAVNVLKALATSDADWGAVIFLPGRPGGRYRLRLTDIDGH